MPHPSPSSFRNLGLPARSISEDSWLSLFGADAAPDLRSTFLRAAKRMTCVDGQILCRQGGQVMAVFVVLGGRIEICTNLAGQPSALLRFSEIGDVLGELETVTGNPAVASLIVRDNAEVLALPVSAIGGALRDPRVQGAMMQRLYSRMAEDNRVFTGLLQGTLRMRLALRLLQIIPTGRVEAHLRQTEIAELLGCTREAANRLLVEMVGEGVIETGRNRVRILERAKLMQIAGLVR